MTPGLLASDILGLAATLSANIRARRPLRLDQQRALVVRLLSIADRVDALEDYRTLREMSGDVARVAPALAVIRGGRG